jgi:hypothetical protein
VNGKLVCPGAGLGAGLGITVTLSLIMMTCVEWVSSSPTFSASI